MAPARRPRPRRIDPDHADSPIRHGVTFTPASATFVEFDSAAAPDRAFALLAAGGGVLMPLGNDGLGARFGWLNDRFAVSWQLDLPA